MKDVNTIKVNVRFNAFLVNYTVNQRYIKHIVTDNTEHCKQYTV